MTFLKCIIIFLFGCNIKYSASASSKLGCRDHENKLVDWYVLYKIPKLSDSSEPLIRNGSGYMYITSNSIHKGWELSNKHIGDKKSIPGNTLAPLYNDKIAEDTLWVLYNDDPPDRSVVGTYGHTKGVVATDKNQGFWMIHSVPNFPPVPRKVYRKNLPTDISTQYPVLTNAANQVRIKDPPYNNKVIIKSSASLEFVSFAKSDKWQKDLYSDFVAPQLRSNILVESYLNGQGRLPSDCHGVKVHNIESIKLQAANFASSQDHSKWVVTETSKRNNSWICVGDINRADTQYNRGGGTVCLKLYDLWKNYRNSVNDIEPCPRRSLFNRIKSWFA
ncbi:hypothetical protein KPH14_007101 [Odynerus spinipes]|uniref:Plancitoxin-1 n=1 Tax=Odynerus spinipes TaxID=1348599 RepID=A0AAD9RRU2_9HYME|nr:hypothetical protein KPH14_007101 [Odynerus spinipes]